MAKQTGDIKIEGTMGDLIFYKLGENYYVKRKISIDKKAIRTSPRYRTIKNTRDEFVHCSKAAMMIRRSLFSVLPKSYMEYSRLSKLIHCIKNLDLLSVHGQRNVGDALKTEAAKNQLCGFNFFEDRALSANVRELLTITPSKEILLDGLLPETDLVFPNTANYSVISASRLQINFISGEKKTVAYESVEVGRQKNPLKILLKPLNATDANDTVVYVLHIRFFQAKTGDAPFHMSEQDIVTIAAIE